MAVVRVKILAFAIGSFIAGLGGSMLAYFQGNVTFVSFSTFVGLTLFAAVYLAGITSISGGHCRRACSAWVAWSRSS